MKNFVANIPLYIGVSIKLISDKFIDLSFKLHITFETDSGKKLVELQKAAEQYLEIIKEAKKQHTSGDRKLVDILNNGGANGRAFTTSLKKPSDS